MKALKLLLQTAGLGFLVFLGSITAGKGVIHLVIEQNAPLALVSVAAVFSLMSMVFFFLHKTC